MKIVIYPDPILRKTAKEVYNFCGRTQRLIDRMRKTVRKTHAIGLAAPQVGYSQQIIIVEGLVMINSSFIVRGDYVSDIECCLSLPGVAVEVNRPLGARGTYQDRYGHRHEFVFAGNKARCFFHELDHLYGILITDFRGKDNE